MADVPRRVVDGLLRLVGAAFWLGVIVGAILMFVSGYSGSW